MSEEEKQKELEIGISSILYDKLEYGYRKNPDLLRTSIKKLIKNEANLNYNACFNGTYETEIKAILEKTSRA